MFSERLLDHFENPRNVGPLDDPAVRIDVANPVCGDELALWARVQEGTIVEARYQTRGCTASIATGSALTELLAGSSIDDLNALTQQRIEEAVGGLPNESKHAARLALDAVRALSEALRPG